MSRWTLRLAIAFLVVLLLGQSTVFAQEDDEDDRRPPPREDRFRDRPGDEGDRPLPPPGGGAAAIAVDADFIYVIFEGTLYKIDKVKLTILGQVALRKEMKPPRDGGDVRRPPRPEDEEGEDGDDPPRHEGDHR